jgi:hypothetical protein
MPAVVCRLGRPERVVSRAAELADALVRVLTSWVAWSPEGDRMEGSGS